MNEATYYLEEAFSLLDMMEHISLADSFMEETEEAKETNKKNDTLMAKAIESVRKAIQALINKAKEMLTEMTDFFREKFMTSEEKQRYHEFKEMIKKNPELANQKVHIRDFKEYEKACDEALKQLEEEARRKEELRQERIQEIQDRLNEKLQKLWDVAKEGAKRAGTSIALSTAIDIADTNALCANAINAAIKYEIVSLEGIDKQLGEGRGAEFEKKVAKYAKNTKLHQAKLWVLRRKKRTLMMILEDQSKQLLKFTNVGQKGKPIVSASSMAKGVISNKKLVVDTVGGEENYKKIRNAVVQTAVDTKVNELTATSRMKKAAKEADQLQYFLFGPGHKKKKK